jgi:predicted Zn-dependent protease with MMP-like domain
MSKRQRGNRARPVRRAGRPVHAPSRHPRDWFETVVRHVEDTLPPDLAPALDEVAVVVEDWPTREDLQDQGLDEDDWIYGLYDGAVKGMTTDWPRKVIIFRGPLEEDFPDPHELEHEIRLTVEHELAHYFGAEDHYDRPGEGRSGEGPRPRGILARVWDWIIHP